MAEKEELIFKGETEIMQLKAQLDALELKLDPTQTNIWRLKLL
jgi:hypothetical protein